MKLKTKVAKLLKRWAERLDPQISLSNITPLPPLSEKPYSVENIQIKLSYPLYMTARYPKFDDMVRNNMAYKVANSIMSSRAFIMDKNVGNDTIEYIGKTKILSPL